MRKLGIKFVLPAIAISALYLSCTQPSADDSVLVGKAAKDFSLKTAEGKSVKPSDFKGDVLVMDFWATWCPPCRESLPNLNRLSSDPDLAKRGLRVVAVNSQETADTVKTFVDKNHYGFTVALDSDGEAERDYSVSGLPTTVVVGRDGVIRKVFVGFDPQSTEKELASAINSALTER
jgi:peroxiredoxin